EMPAALFFDWLGFWQDATGRYPGGPAVGPALQPRGDRRSPGTDRAGVRASRLSGGGFPGLPRCGHSRRRGSSENGPSPASLTQDLLDSITIGLERRLRE